ncbi:MAG: hypothetical protein WCS75_12345 [Sphingomonas sp.]|jgi:hypothetical protein|uniref:hypothetical protein n=1 Tax=Sphingomonas sp. TaxID=28214 RepID=UPI0035630C79
MVITALGAYAVVVALVTGAGFLGFLFIQLMSALGFPLRKDVAMGFAPVVGVVIVFVLGGALNFLGIFTVWAIVGIDVAATAYVLIWRRAFAGLAKIDIDRPMLLVFVTFGAILATLPAPINLNDDSAYLTYAYKLIALRGTGTEPFSERRLFTFLGYLPLQVPVLQWFGLRGLSAFEPGLTVILLGWLFACVSTARSTLRFAASGVIAFLLFSLFLGARPIVNMLPSMLEFCFVAFASFAVLRMVGEERAMQRGLFLLVTIAAIGAIAIRPTMIVYFAVLSPLLGIVLIRDRLYRTMLGGGMLVGLSLIPMMLLMQQSSGTLWYPFLGRGVHTDFGVPIGGGNVNVISAICADPLALLPLLLGFAVAIVGRNTGNVRGKIYLLAAASVALVLIAWSLNAYHLDHYSFPSSVGVLVALLLDTRDDKLPLLAPLAPLALPGAGVLCAILALGLILAATIKPSTLAPFRNRFYQRMIADAQPGQSCNAAATGAAPGSVILAVEAPCAFAVNFKRNKVFLADNLFAAVPCEKRPCPNSVGSFESALRSHRVSYVLVPAATLATHRALETTSETPSAGSPSLSGDNVVLLKEQNIDWRGLAKARKPSYVQAE